MKWLRRKKENDEEKPPEYHHAKHPWRARIYTSIGLIVLAFVGLVMANIRSDGAWEYWRIMAPVYALVSLWLSYYLRRKEHSFSLGKIWHEIFHWLGMLAAVYLISVFVSMGIVGRFNASLQVITLLALTTFLAGVYIEVTFIVIGIMLGLFAAGTAFFEEYLYTIMLPITIATIILIVIIAHMKKKMEKKRRRMI